MKRSSVFYLLLIITASIAIITVPAYAQTAGPSNPNENVTTTYTLLHQNATAVTLRVFNSLKNLISVAQLLPSSDGSFTKTILATGPLWKDAGNYTIIAQYGRYTQVNATFHYNG